MKWYGLLAAAAVWVGTCMLFAPAYAGWTSDGTPVCLAARNQFKPQMVRSGDGEFIIAWEDWRSGRSDIYAQKIDRAGNELWAPDGACVCGAEADQWGVRMIPDCAGGAIIVWQDSRNGTVDIYAQRLTGEGNPVWAVSGVPVCASDRDQHYPRVATDNACGAIVVWEDVRGGKLDIYAQRLAAAAGNPLWAPNGKAVSTGMGERMHPVVCALDRGWLFAWFDYRYYYANVFVQALDAGGEPIGGTEGIPCATYPARAARYFPEIVPDGALGAIVAWQEYPQGDNEAVIAAQKVASDGRPLWSSSGLYLCPQCPYSERMAMVPDGSGGALLVWCSNPAPGVRVVNAQRVSSGGALGCIVTLGRTGSSPPFPLKNDSSSAYLAWIDPERSIRVTKLTMDCSLLWDRNGVLLCASASGQSAPCLVSDGEGGIVGVWEDDRSGWLDIYAQRLDGNGAPTATQVKDFNASALRDGIYLRWTLMEKDDSACFELERRVAGGEGCFASLRAPIDRSGSEFSCMDTDCRPGASYIYRLYCIDVRKYRALVHESDAVPYPIPALALRAATPNPFSSSTAIRYALPAPGYVNLAIFDVCGRRVANLVSGDAAAGTYEATWNGYDDDGRKASPGVYFCRLRACGQLLCRKAVLLR